MNALRLDPEHAAWAELAATLVNTRPRETDPVEKLVGVAELEELLEASPEPAPPVGERDLRPMRELRPTLVEAFEATTPGAFAAALNPLLARSPWQLTPGDGDLTLGPTAEQRPADWFAARAARALAELVIAYSPAAARAQVFVSLAGAKVAMASAGTALAGAASGIGPRGLLAAGAALTLTGAAATLFDRRVSPADAQADFQSPNTTPWGSAA